MLAGGWRMTEPSSEMWGRIEEMISRGSIGWHPTMRPSADLRAVLDYVEELHGRMACLDGLTDEQVAAIPRLVAWFTTSSGSMHEHLPEEMHELNRIFPDRGG